MSPQLQVENHMLDHSEYYEETYVPTTEEVRLANLQVLTVLSALIVLVVGTVVVTLAFALVLLFAMAFTAVIAAEIIRCK